MRLPDVNILIYAVNESSPDFERARPYVEEMFRGRETVAFAWVVALGFLRLATSDFGRFSGLRWHDPLH